MNKLPIGKTIAEAYRFAFAHLGTIIGIIWLPMVLATVLNFLPEIGGTGGDVSSNPVAAGTGAIEGIAILLLTQLLYAMIYVAITRQALGLRKGPAVIHFTLGQPEFRVFGATLLFLMIVLICVLIFSTVIWGLSGLTSQQGGNAFADLPVGLAAIGGGLALIYALVRLGFLLAPVTILENRVDLFRGWSLARGNFWRIFLVLLAVTAPILMIETAAVLVMMGKELLAALPSAGGSDAAIQAHITALEDVFSRHMPEILGVTLILAPFNLGLGISAAAFGYRALAPGGAREVTA